MEHLKEGFINSTTQFNFDKELRQETFEVNKNRIVKGEVISTIINLKNNKFAGADQTTTEMLKYGVKPVVQSLTRLLNNRWEKDGVPVNWKNGVTGKLPKDRDLMDCKIGVE